MNDGVITLRNFSFDDVTDHLAGEDDEQIRWVSGGVSTLESVTDMVRRNQEQWLRGGPRIMLAIEDPSGTLIGMVESNTDHEHFSGHESGDANVSYALYPFARGLGYASRAVTLMEQFLRERGTRRAVIRVEADHERSIALARRLDYDFVGEVAESNGTTYRLYRKTLL